MNQTLHGQFVILSGEGARDQSSAEPKPLADVELYQPLVAHLHEVPEREKAEVLTAFAAHKDGVTAGYVAAR